MSAKRVGYGVSRCIGARVKITSEPVPRKEHDSKGARIVLR